MVSGSELTDIAVTIPEQPGTFRPLYNLIWPRNGTEFSYRYGGGSSSSGQGDSSEKKVNDAHIYISFQPDFDGVLYNLIDARLGCLDITDNELAKVHIRQLAGG
jgi:threonine dehydratase